MGLHLRLNFYYCRHIVKIANLNRMKNKLDKLEEVLKRSGVMRVGELFPLGYPPTYLGELAKRGRAIRQARGIYLHPEANIPAYFSLSLACSKVSGGVICLLSALRYHEIGTQNPRAVWLAIDRKSRLPAVSTPQLRIVRFSGEALTAGIGNVDGPFPLRVYCPAKCVADCFKYRHKIGIEVAIEALKEGWRERRFTIKELDEYARICRVERVLTPYLEAIL